MESSSDLYPNIIIGCLSGRSSSSVNDKAKKHGTLPVVSALSSDMTVTVIKEGWKSTRQET